MRGLELGRAGASGTCGSWPGRGVGGVEGTLVGTEDAEQACGSQPCPGHRKGGGQWEVSVRLRT